LIFEAVTTTTAKTTTAISWTSQGSGEGQMVAGERRERVAGRGTKNCLAKKQQQQCNKLEKGKW